MTHTLRIQPVSLRDVDARLACLASFTLIRSDDGLFLECDDALETLAERALARAGARVVSAVHAAVPGGLVPAVASDLEPIVSRGVVDRVTVRVLSPGEASARLGRRPLLPRRVDEAALRDVLHGCDRALAWHRVVWAPRGVIRSRELRRMRPIVFDRAALARPAERLALASASSLMRWITA